MNTTFLLVALLMALGFLAWLVFELKRKLEATEGEKKELLQRVEGVSQKVSDEMLRFSSVLNNNFNNQIGNLQQTFDRRLHDNTQKLDSRLDNAARSFTEVRTVMAEVLESNKRIKEIGQDISSLQEILKAPKIRGGLGEFFLQDLLAQMFPRQNYEVQYSFKSGEKVDAVIKLKGGLISIDSKFPLENFKKMIGIDSDEEKKRMRKVFLSDVKKHIDAISEKYILPNEGTLDFALMYIPAENVYYEIIVKEGEEAGLLQYAFEKRVVPVSPNTLYIYINTILLGLKGMQIEEHAKAIMNNLKRLGNEYTKFKDEFDKLGKHINDSKNKYDVADKRLEKFQSQLEKSSVAEIETSETLQLV